MKVMDKGKAHKTPVSIIQQVVACTLPIRIIDKLTLRMHKMNSKNDTKCKNYLKSTKIVTLQNPSHGTVSSWYHHHQQWIRDFGWFTGTV